MRKISRKNMPEELANFKGNPVPIELVREDHLKRHLVVENIFDDVLKFEKRLKKFKSTILNKIIKYEDWITKHNDVEDAKFENITLTNYEGTKQVMIKSGAFIDFDENLSLAKAKIDKCFKKWGNKSHPNLKAVIDHYFRIDKKGFINKKAILGLFQFEMNDKDWEAAMELIRKSIVETAKKEYLMVRVRADINSNWEAINLNLSSIEAE